MPYCPKCGTEVREGSKFCPSCGAPLPAAQPRATSRQTPSPSGKRTSGQPGADAPKPRRRGPVVGIVIACVAAAVVLAILGIWFFGPWSSGPRTQTVTNEDGTTTELMVVDDPEDNPNMWGGEMSGYGSGMAIFENLAVQSVDFEKGDDEAKVVISATAKNTSRDTIGLLGMPTFTFSASFTNSYDESMTRDLNGYVRQVYDFGPSMSGWEWIDTYLYCLEPGESRDFTATCYVTVDSGGDDYDFKVTGYDDQSYSVETIEQFNLRIRDAGSGDRNYLADPGAFTGSLEEEFDATDTTYTDTWTIENHSTLHCKQVMGLYLVEEYDGSKGYSLWLFENVGPGKTKERVFERTQGRNQKTYDSASFVAAFYQKDYDYE